MNKLQQRKIYVDILQQATTKDNVQKKCDTIHLLIGLDNQILEEREDYFICDECGQVYNTYEDQVLIPDCYPRAICDDCFIYLTS